jgi:hypothetical protein
VQLKTGPPFKNRCDGPTRGFPNPPVESRRVGPKPESRIVVVNGDYLMARSWRVRVRPWLSAVVRRVGDLPFLFAEVR